MRCASQPEEPTEDEEQRETTYIVSLKKLQDFNRARQTDSDVFEIPLKGGRGAGAPRKRTAAPRSAPSIDLPEGASEGTR